MKKSLAAITLLCYLIVSSGVIVNFHYCMNRLASTEFFATKTDTCGQCGMETHESNGCCRDEVQFFKIQDDQQKTFAVNFELPSLDPVYHTPGFIESPFVNISESRHYHNHSPPLLSLQDTYLINGAFLI